MQIEVFESAPSALNQLVRVRGDGAQPGGRATGGPARAHARGPGGRTADRAGARRTGRTTAFVTHAPCSLLLAPYSLLLAPYSLLLTTYSFVIKNVQTDSNRFKQI